MTDKPCWGITDAPKVDMTRYSSAKQLAAELVDILPLEHAPDKGQSDNDKALPLIFAAAAFLGFDFTEACNPDFRTQEASGGGEPVIMVMEGAVVPDFIDGVRAMTSAEWATAWADLNSIGKGGKTVIENGQGA